MPHCEGFFVFSACKRKRRKEIKWYFNEAVMKICSNAREKTNGLVVNLDSAALIMFRS